MSWHLRLITLFILVILVLATISVSSDPRRHPSFFEKFLLEVTGPLQTAMISSAQAVENVWLDYFALVNLREENEQLRKSLARAGARINRQREAEVANIRLRLLLNFTSNYGYEYLGAKVVAWDPGPWFKTITIDRGEADGIKTGQPVVSDQGVVGRTAEVSAHFAKVLLMVDYNSSIDAYVQRTRVRGILSGKSEKYCALKYILKNEELLKGDVIITSGLDGIFPRGLPLGYITRVNKTGQDIFQEVDVVPAVDFDRVEEVLVVTSEQPQF